MRQIKFRAWDRENMLMSEGLPLTWLVTGDDTDMQFPATEESLPLSDFRQYMTDFDFMLFTGIADKKGTEIYENDVVGWKNRKTRLSGISSVRYNEFLARFEINDGEVWYQMNPIEIEYTVVGNIYQTKITY
jgi:hypothetical protein